MAPRNQPYRLYAEGTPQRELQDAVLRRFPAGPHAFFTAAAERLHMKPKSISGTFYGLLRGKRDLPLEHQAVYLELLPITQALLARLSAEVERPLTPQRRDRIEQLEEDLQNVKDSLHLAGLAHDALLERVKALEEQQRGIEPRAQPAAAASSRVRRQR